jgi:hypothetical protein
MMHVPFPLRRLKNAAVTITAVAAAAALAVVVAPGGGGRTIAATDPAIGAGGEFHELVPVRVFDSREAELDVDPAGAKPTGSSSAMVFDDNVLAVVANVTVVAPTGEGYATIFPTGEDEPLSSVVNFAPGQTVANTAILRPGEGGKVSIHLVTPFAPGTAHAIIDISGWFSRTGYGTRGARVVPIEPTRVYDSDVVEGTTFKGATKIDITARGAAALDDENVTVVPDDPSIVGVIVNLTGVNAFGGSKPTHMSLVPDDFDVGSPPSTSNLNLVPGQTRANLAIVPIGDDGNIHLFNLQGEVRAVVDITGYLQNVSADDATTTGRVIPLKTAFRAFDTRESAFYDQPLGPARAEDFSFEAFTNDVKVLGDPVGPQIGLFGNLTAAGLERHYSWAPVRTHMTAYPTPPSGASTAPPNISNLNLGEGEAVPNMALLSYGDKSQIRFFNYDGYVDYLLDVYAVVLS